MNLISRTITGILTIMLGVFLTAIAIFSEIWILIYGVPILIIGFFILFNKKEDVIEGIKSRSKGGRK